MPSGISARQPGIRTAKNAKLICDRIIEGFTLRQIAKEIGCTSGSIAIWASEDVDFAKQYAQAKSLQADLMADELLDIADDGLNDWIERQQGDEVIRIPDHEHIHRSRLRVDTRKWLMSKMLPKKYGEKVALEHSGSIATVGDHELAERIVAGLMAQGMSEAQARAFVEGKQEES